jgi:hypothetical protein
MKVVLISPLFCLALVVDALAADSWKLPAETAKLKPGLGAPLVIANCTTCHSADYISSQPPLSRPAWRATVEKMRVKYGASIVTNNVDAIAEYLASSYGATAKK